jgi:uncharacterized protein (DUF362 family)
VTYDDVRIASAAAGRTDYPDAPFAPARAPAFAARLPYALDTTGARAGVYEAVVDVVSGLTGNSENPLTGAIPARGRVVIKPNLVLDQHPLAEAGTACTISHASVVRPLVDMVLAACPDAQITICDVPLQSARWKVMTQRGGYDDLVAFYGGHGIRIDLLDLRREVAILNQHNVIVERVRAERDPLGYVAVDLGERSALQDVIDQAGKLRITDYGRNTVQAHHNRERNEYLLPRTVLAADLFINVPKLKTHRKSGLTCAMKNLIGINGDKSWIAHHRAGPRRRGGDEYERFNLKQYSTWHIWNFLKQHRTTLPLALALKKLYYALFTGGRTLEQMKMSGDFDDLMEGSWHGNDTIWRCMADLNHVIFHARRDGTLAETPQRRYLAIVDGVIAGEGEGPMQNSPKPLGLVFGGFNPLAVDHAAAHVMGFDPARIPAIARTLRLEHFPYAASYARCNIEWIGAEPEVTPFVPNRTWAGHIERRLAAAEVA